MGLRGPKPKPKIEGVDGAALRQSRSKRNRKARQIAPPAIIIPSEFPPVPTEDELLEYIRLLPRFDPWRDSDGYCFDYNVAIKPIRFFHEELRHVKGELANKPFRLESWQQGLVGNLFGWLNVETGFRRFRQLFCMVARKNGKSPLAAGLVLYLLFEDGEPCAEIYGAAHEKTQAALVFEHVKGMVLKNPSLAERCHIYQNQFAASIQLHGDFSTYRIISRSGDAAQGFNTHGFVVDEVHTQPNRLLIDAMNTSTGSRRNPLGIYITTADFQRESICNEMQDYAERVLEGTVQNPEILPCIFKANRDEDWKDPEIWKKANPNMGVSVRTDYLTAECKKAQEVPAYENTFRRFHLNQRTETESRAIPMDKWDAGGEPFNEDEMVGWQCCGGLDLASKEDMAAFVMVFPPQRTSPRKWRVIPRLFSPRNQAEKLAGKGFSQYLAWEKAGYLTLTPGGVIDYDYIEAQILKDWRKFKFWDIGADPHNLEAFRQRFKTQAAIEFVIVYQGAKYMTDPSKYLLALIKDGLVNHGNHPVLRWQAQNAMWDDAYEKFVKPDTNSPFKIDGIVGAVMGIARATVRMKEPRSRYESEGLSAV